MHICSWKWLCRGEGICQEEEAKVIGAKSFRRQEKILSRIWMEIFPRRRFTLSVLLKQMKVKPLGVSDMQPVHPCTAALEYVLDLEPSLKWVWGALKLRLGKLLCLGILSSVLGLICASLSCVKLVHHMAPGPYAMSVGRKKFPLATAQEGCIQIVTLYQLQGKTYWP